MTNPPLLPDYQTQRANMVTGQITPNNVINPTLIATMAQLKRENFIPPAQQHLAYTDGHVPLSAGRFLLSPMLQAKLIESAGITENDRVLDIGCATGYSTAIIATLCKHVLGLESDAGLAKQAVIHLSQLGHTHAQIKTSDMTKGDNSGAPYNVMIINGAAAIIPPTLISQLADGGRLIYIYNATENAAGHAMMGTKNKAHFSTTPLFDCSSPYLTGFTPLPTFQFAS